MAPISTPSDGNDPKDLKAKKEKDVVGSPSVSGEGNKLWQEKLLKTLDTLSSQMGQNNIIAPSTTSIQGDRIDQTVVMAKPPPTNIASVYR